VAARTDPKAPDRVDRSTVGLRVMLRE